MTNDILLLSLVAAKIALLHTLLGPDHYLPFIMMSTARKWSVLKTARITLLCGLGHVLSSVALGLVGVAVGIGVHHLVGIESVRGNLAAWLLTSFGMVYFIWGIHRAIKNKPHTHPHAHGDGTIHNHSHSHHKQHAHVHEKPESAPVTPWVLFVIFVLGPCEPLIPILMYPAAQQSLSGMFLVVAIFGFVTLLTMISVVLISLYGVNFLPLAKLNRYNHAIAGASVSLCGCAILFLGL